nr:hypothetical protein [Euryarchaeota archaeon]
MTDSAGCIPARPPVFIFDGVNVTPIDHLFPERSRAFGRVDPNVMLRESGPDIGNHRSAVAFASIFRLIYTHIVNLNPVILHYDNTSADGCPTYVEPRILVSGVLPESKDVVD